MADLHRYKEILMRSKSRVSIPPEIYDKDYFLSDYLEGYEAFKEGDLSAVKAKQLKMLHIRKGISFLEIGFGRGELLKHCAKKGAKVSGVDYSPDAYAIAERVLKDFPKADLQVADCRDLPFESSAFKRVFSGDVIEHLDYEDAIQMLKEAFRVLEPGGFLLVHTTPNTIFTRFTYPLGKRFLKVLDAAAVQAIDDHLGICQKVHVCEHNPITLRRVARDAGISNFEVWIDRDVLRSCNHRHTKELSKNYIVKTLGSLGNLGIVRLFFGNDLYLKAYK